jgi:MOSC domain-containing protein YiiM
VKIASSIEIGRVMAVRVGRAVPYTRPGTMSAIDKRPVTGPVHVGAEGLDGDEQGDRRVHGGPDKAVHFYAEEHYAAWREELGPRPVLASSGAFGENLSTRGLTEATVCFGDRLAIGSARLEISQARQPCWKLNDRFGVADMARRVQATLRTGWYARVIEPGRLEAGDAVRLVARPYPAWPLRRLLELLYRKSLDQDLLREARDLPLPPSWHRLIEKRLEKGEVESFEKRLEGPSSGR